MTPIDEPRPTAPPAPRPLRPRRTQPPRRGPSRGARIISFELSAGLHFLLFLAMLAIPQPKTDDAPKVVKKEPISIEVAFVPQPTQPVDKVAPPGPKLKPHVEPLPRAVEAPHVVPHRTQAAALKPKPPKVAMRPAKVSAPKPTQKRTEQPKPDVQALLAARLDQGRKQEEERLAKMAAQSHEGSDNAPKQPAAGLPKGDPTTTGSGMSGALAARPPLRTVYPEYPPRAQRMGEEGEVTVRLYVTPAGSVARVEVVRSSGRAFFDNAAKSAARRWAFSAAPDGTGEQWGQITMYFRLR